MMSSVWILWKARFKRDWQARYW